MERYYFKYGDTNTYYAVIILSFGTPQYGHNGYGIGKNKNIEHFAGTDIIKMRQHGDTASCPQSRAKQIANSFKSVCTFLEETRRISFLQSVRGGKPL